MYTIKVIKFFLQKENKLKYLFVSYAKSLERGTLLTGFILSLFFISYKHRLTNSLAFDIFELITYYLAIMVVYGIFREISFDYKASKLYQK